MAIRNVMCCLLTGLILLATGCGTSDGVSDARRSKIVELPEPPVADVLAEADDPEQRLVVAKIGEIFFGVRADLLVGAPIPREHYMMPWELRGRDLVVPEVFAVLREHVPQIGPSVSPRGRANKLPPPPSRHVEAYRHTIGVETSPPWGDVRAWALWVDASQYRGYPDDSNRRKAGWTRKDVWLTRTPEGWRVIRVVHRETYQVREIRDGDVAWEPWIYPLDHDFDAEPRLQ